MSKDRVSVLSLGLILLFASLLHLPALKFLLPDFAIEDEMIVLQGFHQMLSGDFQSLAFYKYPGLIMLILALLIYPANLLYNFKTIIHLKTFADFKFLLLHPTLSEQSIIYLARFSSLIAGILALWIFFHIFRNQIRARASLIATLILAFSPAFLFSTSVFKNDGFLLLSLLILLNASFHILEKAKKRDYIIASFAIALCLSAKFHLFSLVPLIYAHFLHYKELSLRKIIFHKHILLSLALSLILFFIFSPFQFLHPIQTASSIALELAIQSRGNALLKASSQAWYHLPILFQLLCAFPLAFGIISYLTSLAGLKFLPATLGKQHFKLFISYPLFFFITWAIISRLGFPHLYLTLTPFFAISSGIFLDRLISKKLIQQIISATLLICSVLFNLVCIRELSLAQSSIVYQSLDSCKNLLPKTEMIFAFFPYRPLAGSDYLLYFQFQPQFQLTNNWLSKNQPSKILIHQTNYLSYLDNPELESQSSKTFFELSQGKLGYRKIKEWQAHLKYAQVYQYLFPDLEYFSVALYQKEQAHSP